MAELQPHEPALTPSCQTGLLAAAALRVLGANHGRAVGTESVREALQRAVLRVEALEMNNDIELLRWQYYSPGLDCWPVGPRDLRRGLRVQLPFPRPTELSTASLLLSGLPDFVIGRTVATFCPRGTLT